MARTTTCTAVNTESVKLPTDTLTTRRRVILENQSGSDTLYFSYDSAVTSSTGHVLSPGARIELPNSTVVYGISGAGPLTVIVSEME